MRRSTRTSRKKVNYSEDNALDAERVADKDDEQPVKKRAKKSSPAGTEAQPAKRNVCGKRGLLSQLTNFPLDVLFEVCFVHRLFSSL